MNKNKRNFWVVMTPILLICVGYSAYMFYSHKTGLNNDFKRRFGMVLDENQIKSAQLPKGNVLNALEAIAVVKNNSDLLEVIEKAKKENINNKKYHWRAIVMMDSSLKDWKITVKEEEVKPAIVCQGIVRSSTQELDNYNCFKGKI